MMYFSFKIQKRFICLNTNISENYFAKGFYRLEVKLTYIDLTVEIINIFISSNVETNLYYFESGGFSVFS